jgi:hypothetical protein
MKGRLAVPLLVVGLAIVAVIIYTWFPDYEAPDGGLMHGTRTSLFMLILFAVPILYTILSARRGKELFIRRIPGLAAIDEAMGRATEMGRPIMFNYGIAGLGIEVMQAMTVLGHLARRAARFGSRIIVPVIDAIVLAVTEGILREAFEAEGKGEAFNPDDIRYLSGEQFAFAAGVVGIMNRENVAANFLIGVFFAESLIFAETGQMIGAIQVAGTPDPQQIPFFVAACDYVIIGDEYYAASAYISREPTLLGSLVGQDVGKAMLLAFVLVVGVAIATIASVSQGHIKEQTGKILTAIAAQFGYGNTGQGAARTHGAWTHFANHVLIPVQQFIFRPAALDGHPTTWLPVGIVSVLLFGVLLFYVLKSLTPRQRKTLLIVLTFAAGFFYPIEFFIPMNNLLTPARVKYASFAQVFGSFTVGLAMLNLFLVHGRYIGRRKPGSYNSVLLFLGVASMLVFGIWANTDITNTSFAGTGFQMLFFGLLVPLKATMFSVLAFYIVTAAYRAFRIKSGEATVMMIAALVVMAGQVPASVQWTSHLPMIDHSWLGFFRLEHLNTWVQKFPGMGASRAILFGVYVGSLAIALRLWLSLERGAYFEQEL